MTLRLTDIARLIDTVRTDLIQRKKPRFPAALKQARPHLAELERSFLYRNLPVLTQVGPGARCAALSADLRCSLYPDWPTSCERFPYTLRPVPRDVVWGRRCPEPRFVSNEESFRQSDTMHAAALASFNERIRDAVLLTHAWPALRSLGLARYLVGPGEDPFEPVSRLAIL